MSAMSYRLHFSPLDLALRAETPAVVYTRDPLEPVTVEDAEDENIFVDVGEPGDETGVPPQDEGEQGNVVVTADDNNTAGDAGEDAEKPVNAEQESANDQVTVSVEVSSTISNPYFVLKKRKYDTCGPNRSPGCGCRECCAMYGGGPLYPYSDTESEKSSPSSRSSTPLISSDEESDPAPLPLKKRPCQVIEDGSPSPKRLLLDEESDEVLYCGHYSKQWKISVDKIDPTKEPKISVVKTLVRSLPPVPHPTLDQSSQMGFGPNFTPLSPSNSWGQSPWNKSCGRTPGGAIKSEDELTDVPSPTNSQISAILRYESSEEEN